MAAETTLPVYIDTPYLIRLAQGMFSDSTSVDVVYETESDEHNYNELLHPRLVKYGRTIAFMKGDGSCYWRSFSHQCWNSQEYHLFARYATAAYMRANIPSYSPMMYEEDPCVQISAYLDNMDKIITEGPHQGKYPGASEIEQKASCDLFGVKIERLHSFGDRVIDELTPSSGQKYKDKYNKEIGISCIAEHADSMFVASSFRPDAPPISKDRIEEIRQTGCVLDQDFIGCMDFPC